MKQLIPVICCLLLLFLPISFFPQNLVPNSGFEELSGENIGVGHKPISACKDWYAGYSMGTDYFSSVYKGVPHNELGIQEPNGGRAYAGICLTTAYMEYLQVKLLDTLEKGKNYLVELYVSRAESSTRNVNQFGILFSRDGARLTRGKGVHAEPNVKFINENGFDDQKEWTKLSMVYTAQGFEAALILGHFIYDTPGGFIGYCHYYIDDVSITPYNGKPPVPFSPKTGETVTLKNIFFDSNESKLLPASYPELDRLVQYLALKRDARIMVSGHTDNTGDEEKNKKLSEERAKAVCDYLVSGGIGKQRMNSVGYGSSRPVSNNKTEEGRQKNRRVEFTVLKK